METRRLGRTGLDVSLLTFGCGAVGGLMTKGEPADQDSAVAWARDNGINHFDTAPLYGAGASETNLGRALGANREGVIVSTKVRLSADDRSDLEGAIRSSLEASLRRLRQDHVDLFQLHNTVAPEAAGGAVSADEVLERILPVFERLRDEGKTRFLGFTANGDTGSLHRLVRSGAFDAAQIFYNALTPSAGEPVAEGYPAQDYRQLLGAALDNGVGSIVVRVLAGGALTGSATRHPLGMQQVDPIGSARDFATDVGRARLLAPVLPAANASSLAELAIRYVISNASVSTTEIGIATLDELQRAADAVNKGPLPAAALARIAEIRSGFVGQPR